MRVFAFAVLVAAMAAPAVAQAADAEAGSKVFRAQCSACHVTDPGKNRVGPSLFGIVGRHSGEVEGFRYSAANKQANIDWTPETLDKYLANPKAVVPGTIMTYAGLKNDKQRADLIAYLETLK
jgi:cytochrome c